MQRHAIERAAHTRAEPISIWYADNFTGGGAHPPELVRMLDDARHGKISTLYVYRLDRLSRRGIRDTLAIVEQLRAAGTKIRTLADGFDVDGPAAEIVLAVLAWAAQVERQAIGERISTARRVVEANGGSWGRPKRMTAEQVKKAEWLHAAGKSHRYIAQVLRVPKATIGRCLKNMAFGAGRPSLKKAAKRSGVPSLGQ
jgi:DNA invertase Pin-like site-specific DNA recombinase